MAITRRIIRRLAPLLNVPVEAIRMLEAASELSGLDRQTLPRELIPLNAIQISRGVLNYCVFQGLHGWVFPYAFVQQMDVAGPAFLPRAHLSVMMNVTHRNWTAIGNPECDIEPIVDPRGLITVFPNGWSLDFWLLIGNTVVFPSQRSDITQRLVHCDPVVETFFSVDGITLRTTAYTAGSTLMCEAIIERAVPSSQSISVIVAIRPFNPEGVSLVHTIRYDQQEGSLQINNGHTIRFFSVPAKVILSTYDDGDVSNQIKSTTDYHLANVADCSLGLATAAAVFPLDEGASRMQVRLSCVANSPEAGEDMQVDSTAIHQRWSDYRKGSMGVETPDPLLNDLFRASLTTVIQLVDTDVVTPGPFTYHQFWFRDAAAMLLALDKVGCCSYVDRVVSAFPRWQERSGFFRSQQGEWDSNGQALWTVWQHVQHCASGKQSAEQLFPSLKRGAQWIDRMRSKEGSESERSTHGLLPPGLSAEHLGLADYYYWDDFWALAGLRAFASICAMLGRTEDETWTRTVAAELSADLEHSLAQTEATLQSRAIPAGPQRGFDSGMIGSIVSAYPLQMISSKDGRIGDSLRMLEARFFQSGMFFQDFVHSGLNTYLTLQVAHALLYRGEREAFLQTFRTVAGHATSTFGFPEAINPRTNGGVMGDGHHGWAAAEVVLSIREMFVYEQWDPEYRDWKLVLLAGVPREWFTGEHSYRVTDVPTPGGLLTISVHVEKGDIRIQLTLQVKDPLKRSCCDICFPFSVEEVDGVNGSGNPINIRVEDGVVSLELHHGISSVVVRPRRDEDPALKKENTARERKG